MNEVATTFLTLGAVSYGGAGVLGMMQAEIQQKRGWLSNERFLEGLALSNLLPGPTAAQLALDSGTGLGAPALFFVIVGAFTFCGGLAMLGFIEQHAVTSFPWLTAQQFLDGLALGQLTPRPVVISTCHPELAAAGGGSAFRFGRNIRTWEDSK